GMGALDAAISRANELLAQRARLVGGLDATTLAQFRHDEVAEVDRRGRGHGIGEIEAVDAACVHPTLEFVGNLLRAAYENRAETADAALLDDFTNRPGRVAAAARERFERGAEAVVLDRLQRLVEIKLREV